MLALTEQILRQYFEATIEKIRDNIRTKRVTKHGAMNASGRTAESLEYVITPTGGAIYGAGYIFALETGRKPTEAGGNGSLRSRIRQWIDEKGITPEGISKDSLAFLITRKIHQEGTELYRIGGNSGILTDAVNEAELQKVYDALFYEMEIVVTNKLLENDRINVQPSA